MAFGVTVDFNANVARFANDVDKASGSLTGFARDAKSSLGSVTKLLAGFGGAFAAVKIGSFVQQGIETADMLGDLSIKTGLAVDELAGLQLVANLSNTSLDQVGDAINDLSIYMVENAEASRQLGLSAKDPLEAFLQFSDLFSSISDDQTKAALANKVLGESYADLAPLLNQGSAAIREQVKTGKEYLPVTEEMAKQAAEFNESLVKLSANTSKYSVILAGPILEGFNSLIENLESATKSGVSFNSVMTGIGDFVFNKQSFDEFNAAIHSINDEIIAQKKLVRQLKTEGGVSKLVDDLLGYDETKEVRNLDNLLKQRQTILEDFKKRRDQQTEEAAKGKKVNFPSTEDINAALNSSGGVSKSQKQENDLTQQASSLFEQTRTSLERLIAKKEKYKALLDAGKISQDTFNRAVKQASEIANSSTNVDVSSLKLSEQVAQRQLDWEREKLTIKQRQLELDKKNPFLNKNGTTSEENIVQFTALLDDKAISQETFDSIVVTIPTELQTPDDKAIKSTFNGEVVKIPTKLQQPDGTEINQSTFNGEPVKIPGKIGDINLDGVQESINQQPPVKVNAESSITWKAVIDDKALQQSAFSDKVVSIKTKLESPDLTEVREFVQNQPPLKLSVTADIDNKVVNFQPPLDESEIQDTAFSDKVVSIATKLTNPDLTEVSQFVENQPPLKLPVTAEIDNNEIQFKAVLDDAAISQETFNATIVNIGTVLSQPDLSKIREDVQNVPPLELPVAAVNVDIKIDVAKAIEELNQAVSEAQNQVKPVFVPVVYGGSGGSNFDDEALAAGAR